MLHIGDVQFDSNLLLAPIAGYCDLAFRRVVRSVPGYGGHPTLGLACTDLLCPQAVLSENEKSLWLAATCPEDQPVCMQLYGVDPDVMAQAAQWSEAHGATTVDINMGCPVDKVTKKNGGSTLLCDPVSTVRLAKRIVDAVSVPVTAKIRLGWDEDRIITDTLPGMLADVGICAVTVHGRTTAQKFRGTARWRTGGLDSIAATVEATAKRHPDVPVIGNGDVKTPEDARGMINETGCAGVMIGRGALGQPWLFRDTAYYLATGELPTPLSQAERIQLVLDHFDLLLEYRGEREALHKIRSRMSWYSRHLQPWPHLKRDVQPMQSADEFRSFVLAKLEAVSSDCETNFTAVA